LKQLRDGPLHWERAGADFRETFDTWLLLENFANAQWIRCQWVVMFLKKCACEVWEMRKKGRWGNKRPAMDLGDRAVNNASDNVPEVPDTTFKVVIWWVPNGNTDQTSSIQLQASHTVVRHWEELIDFIEENCCPKEPYCLTAIYKCNLTQEEWDEEYMGLDTPGQTMNDPLYGQIQYNCSLGNAFKLKLGHNVRLFLVEIMAAPGKDTVEHIMRPAKVIPASPVTVSYAYCQSVYLDFGRIWWKRKIGGWGGRWERDW